jgi:hypothetical protein
MGSSAHVKSIEAIEQFRAGLGQFGDEVGQALATIRADVQRFVQWLEHDQLSHWQHEIRVREERVAEAKGDLHRCLSATIDPRRTPSCLQEKKVLEAAKRRLEEAQQKLIAVRRWIPIVRQAAFDYSMRAEPLAGAIAGDLPRANAFLLRSLERLEAYLDLKPPPGQAVVPAATEAAGRAVGGAIEPKMADPTPATARDRAESGSATPTAEHQVPAGQGSDVIQGSAAIAPRHSESHAPREGS